jgi:hypothetical protein
MADDALITTNDPVKRHAEYWYRAEMMHGFVHSIMREHNRDINAIYDKDEGWAFETFMTYWLSALFIVVEGFNKLNRKDARVQKLFSEHIQYLKAMRHETYHFVIERQAEEIFKQLNWAEELHEAIGTHIREYVGNKAKDE